jgi:hypothetical protein
MSLKSAVACVGKVFTPKFYADQLSCWISGARRDFIRGSAAPLFKAMLIVGLVGYTVEYTNVGSKFLFRGSYFVEWHYARLNKNLHNHFCKDALIYIVPFAFLQSTTLRRDKSSSRRRWPTRLTTN